LNKIWRKNEEELNKFTNERVDCKGIEGKEEVEKKTRRRIRRRTMSRSRMGRRRKDAEVKSSEDMKMALRMENRENHEAQNKT